MSESDIEIMEFIDGRDREVQREVRQTLDIRKCLGSPGYPLLVIAANPHLSLFDIAMYLYRKSQETPGIERPKTWIHKRRWLFRPANETSNSPTYDPDRRHADAVRIMAQHPELSLHAMQKLLREHRIVRSKEWIRQHRCDGLK